MIKKEEKIKCKINKFFKKKKRKKIKKVQVLAQVLQVVEVLVLLQILHHLQIRNQREEEGKDIENKEILRRTKVVVIKEDLDKIDPKKEGLRMKDQKKKEVDMITVNLEIKAVIEMIETKK